MSQNYIKYGGLALFLFGWIIASVFGYALDVYRVTLGMPFVICGAVIYLWGFRVEAGSRMVFLLLLLCSGYLLMRALFSPVQEFVHEEVSLITAFCLSFLVGWRANQQRGMGMKLLLGGVGCIFLVHVGIALYQSIWDMEFAFFNSKRTSLGGVSGLFWHRNYLAGFLEFFLPLVLAGALFTGTTLRRVLLGFLLILGLVILFLSHSRGGLIATGLGMFTVTICWVFGRLFTRNLSTLKVVSVVVLSMLIALIGLFSLKMVSESRGRSTSVMELFAEDERVFFASMGLEHWMENPLLGGGSRAFDYWSDRNWHASVLSERQGKRAVMVHNDYVQLMAEYGLVGFFLLMGFLGYGFWRLLGFYVELRSKDQKIGEREAAMGVAGLGCLVAGGMHSLLDFNLHILPNLMLFGLVLGGAIQVSYFGKEKRQSSVLCLAAVALPALLCVLSTYGYWLAAPSWLKWERARIKVQTYPGLPGLLEKGLDLFEKAPTGALAAKLSGLILDEVEEGGYDQLRDEQKLVLDDVLEKAVAVNPYDGVLWMRHGLNLRMKDGPVSEVEHSFFQAMAWKARRERNFGLMWQFGEYQREIGYELWKKRKPEEALMRFEVALEYMAFSRTVGYYKEGHRRVLVKELQEKIDFLKNARVRPLSRAHIPLAEDFYDGRVKEHKVEIWKWDVENH